MVIYCCGCKKDVYPRLTFGMEIYKERKDLWAFPFWVCDVCKNYVGCHKGNLENKPLGNIPTKEIRNARQHIHKILDPLWKGKKISRKELYGEMTNKIGYQYHTAEIKSLEEARTVYKLIKEIEKNVTQKS